MESLLFSSGLISVARRPPLALFSSDQLPSNIIPLSVLDPLSPFCFENGSRLFKRGKKMRTASLSHSRCIQCLALSKALKCKTDGRANKDQREQPCPPGLLSSHARRCCHSESRPRRLPRSRRSSPSRATTFHDTATAPRCQCLTQTAQG